MTTPIESSILANALLAGPGALEAFSTSASFEDEEEVVAFYTTLAALNANLALEDVDEGVLQTLQGHLRGLRANLSSRSAEKYATAMLEDAKRLGALLRGLPPDRLQRAITRTSRAVSLASRPPLRTSKPTARDMARVLYQLVSEGESRGSSKQEISRGLALIIKRVTEPGELNAVYLEYLTQLVEDPAQDGLFEREHIEAMWRASRPSDPDDRHQAVAGSMLAMVQKLYERDIKDDDKPLMRFSDEIVIGLGGVILE